VLQGNKMVPCTPSICSEVAIRANGTGEPMNRAIYPGERNKVWGGDKGTCYPATVLDALRQMLSVK
jgi:hypothetical protein